MAMVWPSAIACALPTAIFNRVRQPFPGAGILFCITDFPEQAVYKFIESGLFYFIPIFIQVALYAIIAKRLYVSTDELHTRFQMRNESNCKTDRTSETIRARKGVVKMLVASVMVYILCYAPPQILLFYNTISPSMFQETWSFLVFVNIIAYVNSAANPILYSIFSQNFRRNFKKCLCYVCLRTMQRKEYVRTRFDSFDSRAMSRRVSSTRTTTVSRL